MNKNILNTGIQEFIHEKLHTDIVSVLLKKPIFNSISNRELAEQLEARKKCENKLPTWFKTKKIYYPNKLNIEQTSSEITARYKAEIVSGKSLLDVTGGLGVDSYFFSKKIDQVYHCEVDKNLSRIAAYNFDVLGVKNIKSNTTDGLEFLKSSETLFDWVYLDPSRRDDNKKRVFLLSDCSPNILENLDLFFSKTENVLIKTAPLLDLSLGIKQLNFVKEIHVVAVDNDVKELLWILKKNYESSVQIKTINFSKNNNQTFDFVLKEEEKARPTYSEPLSYLYELNSAILKSGGFKLISARLNLKKLHEHTHLYTSNELQEFLGRIFKIEKILPYTKKEIRRLGIKKANVKTRNFPEKVEAIRRKFGINDGGSTYLFFTKDHKNNKIVIICLKHK